MADAKISALSAATTLAGTEVLAVVQAGATVKATITQVLAAAQPLDSDLTAIAALTTTSFGRALLALADAAALRTAAVLVPGTDVQAYDAELAALAGLVSAADKGIQFTGSGTAATYDLTTAGKALLDDADASAQRTTLGLGTAATQPTGTFLQTANNLSDVTAATARTNLGLGALATLASVTASLISDATANGRSLITAADYAAMRTLLGLVIGTNVQAWDADLDAIAAITATGVLQRTGANTWAAAALVAADIPSLAASKITTGQIALARGGTNADLSATGGANQVVRQDSSGGAFTVSALAAADIPNIAESQVTSLTSDLALKSPLASPTFTGTPAAPSATAGTNTTQIATTAFVTTAVAGGGSGSMVKLATGDLGSDTATIDFTSISGAYRSLHIILQARMTENTVDNFFYVQFNGDTGANYWDQRFYATGSTTSPAANNAQTKGACGLVVGATGRANSASVILMDIPFYAGTTFEKTMLTHHGEMYSTNSMIAGFWAIRWGSTAAITSIKFLLATGNFLSGSTATLYGLT